MLSMLAGAHAEVIPLITRLYDAHTSATELDVELIKERFEAVISYDAEHWVRDMIAEMVMDFCDNLPDETVYALGESLSDFNSMPFKICLYFMNSSEALAAHIIETSGALDDMDIIYRLQADVRSEMIAAARRENLSATLMQALIDKDEPLVYMELLNNKSVRQNVDVAMYIAEAAQKSVKTAWYMVTTDSDRTLQKIA